ncbi:MAG: ABC transporter ATP-binding protein, partial [Candidatus Acetothermia bacterium]
MECKTGESLLEITDLKVHFDTEEGTVEALDNISVSISDGSIHGLIGETGCGKSVTSLTILQLLDQNARIVQGHILYKGEDLLQLREKEIRGRVRGGQISMIFQDPSASLNPVYTAGDQVQEAVNLYQTKDAMKAKEIVLEQFDQVDLPDPADVYQKFPYELSGGMKQRVMIAVMLACNSSLLIADEPTTALDVSVQAQFLKVLQELQDQLALSLLYITHDMAVVSEICDRVTVMYAGQIVESASVRD